MLSVATLTLASGGDNVGAYIPIVAGSGSATAVVYLVVFLACLAVWCLLGQVLTSSQVVHAFVSRWADAILAVVLTAVGVVILLSGR